jgi:ankyrin repeat protein
MRAAARGDLNMIQLLYANSKRANGKNDIHVDASDYYGQTSLMRASRAGHFCVVKFLVNQCKAKAFGVFDRDHWNALMHASARGHWHIVELLVAHATEPKQNPE